MTEKIDPVESAEQEIELLVAGFASALRDKLIDAERKYGHRNAWKRDDWADDLRAELARHVAKGDPRDVAAYCAFAWYHGWSLAAAAAGMVMVRREVLERAHEFASIVVSKAVEDETSTHVAINYDEHDAGVIYHRAAALKRALANTLLAASLAQQEPTS